MKIHCFDTTPEEEAYLQANLDASEIAFHREHIHESGIADPDAQAVIVFVGSEVTSDVLNRFPALKCVITRSTGYDHIDLSACAKRAIVVSNVPSYGEHTVAEFAMGLILTLSRKLYLGVDRLKETGEFSYDGLEGFDLREKTIGVVGTGRIGKHVLEMAKGFSMTIVAYDPFPNQDLAHALGFTYVSLEELLQRSDIVTLHVPYMTETHHLLNKKNLALMKSTALLINVSRGGLVDTDALVSALRDKKIGGAGLDVLEEEGALKDEFELLRNGHLAVKQLKTLLEDHELMRFPNVVITPHMAFNTAEGVERILKTTIENIKGFQSGTPVNIVKTTP